MTADEALAQAEAEGLTLARSDNQSGFRNVSVHPEYKVRPYMASVTRDGKRSTSAASPRPRRRRCTSPERPRGRLPPLALPPPMTAARRWRRRRRRG